MLLYINCKHVCENILLWYSDNLLKFDIFNIGIFLYATVTVMSGRTCFLPYSDNLL